MPIKRQLELAAALIVAAGAPTLAQASTLATVPSSNASQPASWMPAVDRLEGADLDTAAGGSRLAQRDASGDADSRPISVSSVEALGAAIEMARAEGVDVYAPNGYASALRAHEAAQKDLARGRDARQVQARIEEGRRSLQQAQSSAANARQSYARVVRAREDALAAQAPRLAPAAWEKAAMRFGEAMRENEAGDLGGAQRRAAEAEVLLREVELAAIKAGILDEARASIAQADEVKAGRHAPNTLQSAKRHLADAEQEIQRNRYDVGPAKRLAEQARSQARHAIHLAQLIERMLREEKAGSGAMEERLLSWEQPLERIARDMDLSVTFERGIEGPLQEIGEQVQRQAQELRRLRQELADRDERLAALDAELQRTQARLGGVSEERMALQRRVDAQERLRMNVASVEASFTPAEARVYRQGEDVVISLLGIRFPSGRSTIDGASAELMEKVRQALERFPGASISVQGHTDSHGSDSTNLILSQDRADAVKQYLAARFGLDPEKISSIGYGEARPVASNETAEGRARNRRIDLIIHVGN